MEQTLLTVEETAKTLGISPRTLWTLTNEKAIAAVRIRRRVLYSRSDVEAYINAQRTMKEAS